MARWQLYQTAKTTGTLPSHIFGLPKGSWLAYDFDRFIIWMGQWVENHRTSWDKKGKQRDHLTELLSPNGQLPWGKTNYLTPQSQGNASAELPTYTYDQWLEDQRKYGGAEAVQ